LRFDHFFESGVEWFSKFTKRLTKALRADRPLDYLPVILGFAVVLVGGGVARAFATHSGSEPFRMEAWLPEVDLLRCFAAILIALAVFGVLFLKRWTTQLILLSVAGFLIAFYFVLYRAPDLALTQILIEAVTLLLVLLLLARFPRAAESGEINFPSSKPRQAFNVVLSVCVGVIITAFILLATALPHANPIGLFFLEETVPLAHGSNAVNTILVDFRGFDTLGEITVLVIAMLGGLGLLMRHKRSAVEYRKGPHGEPGFGMHHEKND
jgi:multisubunit Na+/H+ antiporter MnhB subunit